jgi:hypothetical protein
MGHVESDVTHCVLAQHRPHACISVNTPLTYLFINLYEGLKLALVCHGRVNKLGKMQESFGETAEGCRRPPGGAPKKAG